MEWIRPRDHVLAGPPPMNTRHDMTTDGGADHHHHHAPAPKFVLVDSKKRVRELTEPHALRAFSSMVKDEPMNSSNDDGFGPTREELEEQAQLEQQLQYQREEMRLGVGFAHSHNHHSLPRPQAAETRPRLFNHAFTYSESSSNAHQFPNALKTPPTVPPISPFAGMALSAPAKSTLAGFGSSKPPNPFGLHVSISNSVESSPRLPSLNSFRLGSPGPLKMGIAAPRPPPLSLRSSSDISNNTSVGDGPPPTPTLTSFRSLSSSSLASPHHRGASSPAPHYSQSLPGVSYLHERRTLSRTSFDGAESLNLSSEDEDAGKDGMMLLSSSAEQSGALLANARSGRVCRYANCNNIARSRGLCRTHGGGKRCSHPNCNKSAQANRKCIAHGGGTPCSFGDCEKTAQSRGLCKAHGGGARCKHPDCPKSSQSKGLCRGHGGGIKCKEDGCEKWVQKNGYCIKHGRERTMTS